MLKVAVFSVYGGTCDVLSFASNLVGSRGISFAVCTARAHETPTMSSLIIYPYDQ
jgi:hypothetical protein